MGVSFERGAFLIDTPLGQEEVRRVLAAHAPWRHKIDFSCGVSSADYDTFKPFNDTPTAKIQLLEEEIGPLSGFRRALDVGCNAGYNSIYLAARYGMQVVGFDSSARHVQVATELARLAGVSGCAFQQGNAETFLDPEGFDLIIHFGTLYHLRNPVRAIETALKNLRPGGTLLIETQVYGWPWETRAQFIYGLGGDTSNWWALGERALLRICGILGVEAARIGRRHRAGSFRQYRAYFRLIKPRA